MAGRKPGRGEIDRFSGHAITSVSITPEQKRVIASINAKNVKKPTKATAKSGKK